MRTLTIKKGGGKGNFTPGWHTLTAAKAQYGEWLFRELHSQNICKNK